MNSRQYEMLEMKWHAAAPEGNTEALIPLEAAVTSPDGSVTFQKGFYAGKETYVLRFLPLQSGTFQIRVSGIINEEKVIVVDPSDGSHHGPVHPDGTHLKYQDGTPFYSFGATVYALAHQAEDLMDETIQTLSESPFNKVRMCVFPKDYHYNKNEPCYYPFHKKDDGTWDPSHPDFRFWDAFEDKLQRLQDLGIEVDLILFHPYDRWGFASMSQENNLTYLDYLLRRFAAFPNIWWSLANEYDLCRDKTLSDWKVLEEKVAADDPYHHMLSIHNCLPMYDFSSPNLTHCSVQTRMTGIVRELQEKYKKPVLFDECCYEGNLEEAWGNLSGEEMVRRFWRVTVTGGWCTHGETFLDDRIPDDKADDAVIWWAKGGKLIGTSPERIAYLRSIIESLPGPLDPLPVGMAVFEPFMRMDQTQFEACMKQIPARDSHFISTVRSIPHDDYIRGMLLETDFAGHAGEDAYLYYLDEQCASRKTIDLPENASYQVDVIDTWNMTRATFAEHASGKVRVKLPGKPYMAILAVKNQVS